jgi:hypothetical protein
MIATGMGILLASLVATGASGALAQEATPIEAAGVADAPRPAHIHVGSCPDVGEGVAPLNDLMGAAGADDTAAAIAAGVIPVQASCTTVPLALEDILPGEHAINGPESAENIERYIACGDLSGMVDVNGSLIVGLREVHGSGYAGIAVLTPSAQTGSTDVTVFVAQNLTSGGDGAQGGGDTQTTDESD